VAVKFILLATQRTGSTWVRDMLNSHPDVKVYNELFLRGAKGVPKWQPNDIQFASTFLEERAGTPRVLTRRYWTIKLLDRIFDQPTVQAAGFKLMYEQALSSPEILPYAAIKRVAVIHLVRRNLLDVIVSSKLAEASGIYHVATDDRPALHQVGDTLAHVKVRLDPTEIIQTITRLARVTRAVRAWLRITRTPTHEVLYEDLLSGPSAFGPMLRFLGLDDETAAGLHSALRRRNRSPRLEVIENVAEIQQSLSGTRFEAFL
jgi:LPS sulfotransferase NodH